MVRVKSAPADGRGLHTAVALGFVGGATRFMLPPLTLFRVVGVQEGFRMRSSDHALELVELGQGAGSEVGGGGGGGGGGAHCAIRECAGE